MKRTTAPVGQQPSACAAGAADVMAEERRHIERARKAAEASPQDSETQPDAPLSGLALSGGGIRSASICMGFLQGMAEHRLVSSFDYVSAVSGGGYALGWWSALVHRLVARSDQPCAATKVVDAAATAERIVAANTAASGELQDVWERRHVRDHANYLTVRTGPMSVDTWSPIFIIARNLAYGLLVVGGAGIVAAWAVLAVMNLVSTSSATSWLALSLLGLATLALVCGWCRTCLGVYDSRVEGVAGTLPQPPIWRVTISALVVGATAAAATFVMLPTLNDPGFIRISIQAGLWLLVLADAVLIVWLLKAAFKDPRRNGLRWMIFPPLGLLILSLFVLPVAEKFLGEQPIARLTGWWLCLALMHAWQATRIVGVLRRNWSPSDSGFSMQADMASYVASISLVGCLLWFLPALLDGYLSALRSTQQWVRIGLLTAVLAATGALANALATLAEGSQADADHRELWAWWGGALMLDAIRAGALLVAGGFLLQIDAGNIGRVALYAAGAVLPAFALALWLSQYPRRVIAARCSGALAVLLFGVLLAMAARAIADTGQQVWMIPLLGLIVGLVLCRSSPNTFSMHELYRNRLVRAFLAASVDVQTGRAPTGFNSKNDPDLANLVVQGAKCRASKRMPNCAPRPFPIWSAAVNVTLAGQVGLQERRAASFSFSPLFCGMHIPASDRQVGSSGGISERAFAPTQAYGSHYDRTTKEYECEPLSLGTVVATSGAAFSSNSGSTTTPERALLLTLLGFRLGRWFPNPARRAQSPHSDLPETPWTAGLPLFISKHRPLVERFVKWSRPLILREALSRCDVSSEAVYVTDGGHFENLAVYELIRRRVMLIVCVDAG